MTLLNAESDTSYDSVIFLKVRDKHLVTCRRERTAYFEWKSIGEYLELYKKIICQITM